MTLVTISDNLKAKVPGLVLSCIECDVIVSSDCNSLWEKIEEKTGQLSRTLQVEQISRLPAIAASRLGYKACGKDPARYRLSAEALLRRVVQGKGLYKVNNVVDLLNLVSITTGFSIGGYDADKVEGTIVFDTGGIDEPYQGIGRGMLNIEFLPVFRDKYGAFGSPTSDSVRTAVTSQTRRFLMMIVDFGTPELLEEATVLAMKLLQAYSSGTNMEVWKVG